MIAHAPAHPLAAGLRALGVEADVDVEGTLAVIRARDGAGLLARDDVRAAALALLAPHALTHLALELADDDDDDSDADTRAALPRHQPPR